MQKRRKTDNLLFFVIAWAILLWLTNMAIDCGILVPTAEIDATDRVVIVFTLPTLAVITTATVFFFLKSKLQG